MLLSECLFFRCQLAMMRYWIAQLLGNIWIHFLVEAWEAVGDWMLIERINLTAILCQATSVLTIVISFVSFLLYIWPILLLQAFFSNRIPGKSFMLHHKKRYFYPVQAKSDIRIKNLDLPCPSWNRAFDASFSNASTEINSVLVDARSHMFVPSFGAFTLIDRCLTLDTRPGTSSYWQWRGETPQTPNPPRSTNCVSLGSIDCRSASPARDKRANQFQPCIIHTLDQQRTLDRQQRLQRISYRCFIFVRSRCSH